MTDPTRTWLLPPVWAAGWGGLFLGGPVWLGWPRRLPDWADSVGLGFGAAGFALGLSALLWFRRVRTTHEPNGTPTSLVIGGPYRVTRNPMYLALTLTLAGLAFWLGRPAGFLAPAAFLLTVNAIYVPREEARLADLFGEAFREYQTRTRRWL